MFFGIIVANKVKDMKEEKAVALRAHGYTCSQAVACTYCEELGIEEKEFFRIMEGFGGGFGCTLGTCGALSAAIACAGLKKSTADLEHPSSKGMTYTLTRELTKRFQEEAGALQCAELKGIHTGRVLCDCNDCVRIACRLIEEIVLAEQEKQSIIGQV